MFFAPKSHGFFVELSDQAVLLARTSAAAGQPLVIEAMSECARGDSAELANVISQLKPKKTQSKYLHATVGVYPASRLVAKHALELKRLKEPTYLNELFAQQFHIEQDKYTIAVMNASDGADYDLAKPVQKDVVFSGLPNAEIIAVQNALLESGIYPERLELGSLAMLGGLVDYLVFTKSKVTTLVLEIGANETHSFIVSAAGVESSRTLPQGLDSMIPIVQKELSLKDEDSARRLFYSNTFDFAGMGPLLTKRLLKELQSSIGFYEVQTGQSIGQVVCFQLSPKLAWLDASIASSMGIASLRLNPTPWLASRQVTVPDALAKPVQNVRWFGLLSLIAHYNHSAHVAA